MKRIGLFGGTFNPVHNGHLWAAKTVQKRFGLDAVVLIPAAIPPHKRSKDIAPAADRLEMVRLAVADCDALSVSDVELVRSGPSYTIDTVHHFKAHAEVGTRLFFIVGVDAFLEIDTWKFFQELFMQISMIVLDRPISGHVSGTSLFETMHGFLRTRISEGYTPSEDGRSFFDADRQPVHLFSGEMKDISSTFIRRRTGRGDSISALVPPATEEYIGRKGLYR